MLRDSAHIQEFEAEWRSRKGKRKGTGEVSPLYTMADAEAAIACLCPHPYSEVTEISEGIKVRFIDAGHLLGSSSIEIWLTENGEERKIVFSGDIGNLDQPLIRDPQYITEADYVVMESTYGNRRHDKPKDYAKSLAEVIQKTFDREKSCYTVLCSGQNSGTAVFYKAYQGGEYGDGSWGFSCVCGFSTCYRGNADIQ